MRELVQVRGKGLELGHDMELGLEHGMELGQGVELGHDMELAWVRDMELDHVGVYHV